MHGWNWDDLKIALAVARTGSVSLAAKELGVAHTTISRRLAAFETAAGTRLFDRTPKGYVVNPDRIAAFEALRAAGAAVAEAEVRISNLAAPPGESLRLTSTDTFCVTVLPRVVRRMMAAQPGLRVTLLSMNTRANLGLGEVDITLRPAPSLPPDLEGEIVGSLGFALYDCPKGSDAWIGLKGALLRSNVGQWLAEEHPITAASADSFVVAREMVADGLGRTYLPCVLGDADPRIRRISGARPVTDVPIWLAGHKDLSDTGRLRRAKRLLRNALSAEKNRLAGT